MATPAPVEQAASALVDQNVAQIAPIGSTRSILLFHTLTWGVAWLGAYFTKGNSTIINFHLTNWGFDLFFYIIWAILLLAISCGPQALRRSPLQWVIYALFTPATGFLASSIISYYNPDLVFYGISVMLGANLGALIYALSAKVGISLAAAGIYVLGGVALWYQGFIIFSDIPLLKLIVGAIIALALGVYVVYDTINVLLGSSYNLAPGQHSAGAVILWLEYALVPLRLIGALASSLRRPL